MIIWLPPSSLAFYVIYGCPLTNNIGLLEFSYLSQGIVDVCSNGLEVMSVFSVQFKLNILHWSKDPSDFNGVEIFNHSSLVKC